MDQSSRITFLGRPYPETVMDPPFLAALYITVKMLDTSERNLRAAISRYFFTEPGFRLGSRLEPDPE
jgi:hypothetical protein